MRIRPGFEPRQAIQYRASPPAMEQPPPALDIEEIKKGRRRLCVESEAPSVAPIALGENRAMIPRRA